MVLAGSVSRKITSIAGSCPVLPKVSSYSSTSPGSTAPPLRSVTLLLKVSFTLGTKISVASVTTPKSIVSELEDTRTTAEVAPLGNGVLGLVMSAS